VKDGDIFLRPKEITRHQIIGRCLLGRLSNKRAGELLNLSVRQVQRLKKRVKDFGLLGVVHQNRGRCPANKIGEGIYARITELIKGRYQGLNTLHLQEKLEVEVGIRVGRETIRRLYKQMGVPLRKCRRRRRFARRERKPQSGMMLQMDGSCHDWFGTGEKFVLIAAIDDATNEVPWASFFESESSLNYLSVLRRIVERKGLFWSLYVDRASSFKTLRRDWTNRKSFRRDDFEETQVHQALKEVGIEMINARTPQAKGRVERLFGFFQDRLLKEMRIMGINTAEAGNEFLKESWLPYYNQRYTHEPALKEPAYREVPAGVDLREVFCVKQPRQVKNDNTLSFQGRLYKLLADPWRASYARATVEVRKYPDQGLSIFYGQRPLSYEEVFLENSRKGLKSMTLQEDDRIPG